MKTYLLTDEVQIIGRAGEQGGITVAVDVSDWQEEYQDGVGGIMVTRPGGNRMPLVTTISGNLMLAELPPECTDRPGRYDYTATWTLAGAIQASQVYQAIILSSEIERGVPPERWHGRTPDWAKEIYIKAEQILNSVDAALQAEQSVLDARDDAQEAQAAAETAQGAAEDAKDDAEAAKNASEEALASITQILDESQETIATMQSAADGIEAQKDTMIASIASVAGQGTDTTMTQSGVAADAKVVGDELDDLKSALDDKVNNIENGYLVMDYIDGEYINSSTGAVEQNSSYMRTDYIDCEGFDILVFIGVTHANYNNKGAFYDTNKEKIDVAFGVDVNHTIVIVPSNAKWFRISGEKSKGYFSAVRVVNSNGIPQIIYNKDLIYNLYKQIEPQNWQTGKYVDYNTGAIGSAAAWNATEIIPTGKYIVTNANATQNGAIVFLDSNGIILDRYKNMGNYVRVYTVPDNTAVCRLCYNRGDAGATEVFVIGGKISDEAPILSVIGDSISSDNATGYKPCNYLAWPKMLVNKFGNNVKLDRHTMPGKRLYDTLISDCASVDSKAKMVVVMLGINDIGKGYTMGDIDTIMSQPLEDVETNTLMGVYRKGLETLKNRLSNDSVIVCISPVTNQQIDAWGDSTVADFRASYEELVTLRESIKKMVIAEGSAENGWIYIDGRSLFELSTESLNLYYGKKLDGTSDYTHLNLCGESILASAIFNTVVPIGCIMESNYIT